MAEFDINAARQSGFTDAQIADYLGQKVGFDTQGARMAGHSDGDIVGTIITKQLRDEQAATDARWRPLAQGLGQAAGMSVAGAAGVGSAPVTGGTSLLATPAAMYGAGALGDAMGGQVYDLGMNAYRSLTGQNPKPLTGMGQGSRAVNDVALNASLGPIGDAAIGKTIAASQAAGAPMRSFVQGKLGKAYGSNSNQLYQDFVAAGMTPTVDMVINNPEARAFGQSLRGVPGSGKVMGEMDAKNLAAANDYAQSVAAGMGQVATPADVGNTVKSAAVRTKAGIGDQFNALYDGLDSYVGPNDSVPLNNTMAFFEQFAPNKSTPFIDEVSKSINPLRDKFLNSFKNPYTGEISPVVTGDQARDLKSVLGKVYNGGASDIPAGLQKQLYGSVKDDIAAYAATKGPEATQALNEVNSMYSRWKGNPAAGDTGNKNVLDSIIEQTDPGGVYDSMARRAMHGNAGGDFLGRANALLPPESTDSFRATLFDRLGRATPGAQNAEGDKWSFSTFLTNFNKMTPETKTILGYNTPEVERLARIAEAAKDLQGMANTSGTATKAEWLKQTDVSNFWDGLKKVSGGLGTGTAGLLAGNYNPGWALAAGAVGAAGQKIATPLFRKALAERMIDPAVTQWFLNAGPKQPFVPTPGAIGYLTQREPDIANALAASLQQPKSDR